MTATFAIDVGGTWIRSCGLTPMTDVRRTRTPSILNYPRDGVADLRERLVTHLSTLAPDGAVVAVSCGAALDESRGIAYGSAPLWGLESRPFDLLATLSERRRDVQWSLVNDVTAGLADFAGRYAPPTVRQVGYLTISSGIAYRQADWAGRVIPVDEWGLQGEIGHALAQVAPERAPTLSMVCDCGRCGHIGAISSGPGIERLLAAKGLPTGANFTTMFTTAVNSGAGWAAEVLATAVAPIAEFIRMLWRITPHLDLIGLGGGVVEGLREHYRAELFDQLRAATCYAERPRDEAWLSERIRVCGPGDVDPMAGAVAIRSGELRVLR